MSNKEKNILSLFDLTGKKAIVTGVSSMNGLAKSMAEGLCEAGAEVCVIDISDKLFDVVDLLHKKGYKAHGVKANLADKNDLNRAFLESLEKLGGKIDILVNAAGVQRRSPTEEFKAEDWDIVINVNLNAVFFLSQLVGREMLKQGKGKIINIASMLSFLGGYMVPAYSASKGAVAQLTKALTNEWASKGININAIAPGYMATDMGMPLMKDPIRNKEVTDRIPMKRWGNPDDMKGLTVFLASEASDYLSGAVIPIDGGFLCR